MRSICAIITGTAGPMRPRSTAPAARASTTRAARSACTARASWGPIRPSTASESAPEVPMSDPQTWPALPLAEWKDTLDTLHMWTQIVGKVRLVQSPLVNHWWNVPLYVTPRGLTTSLIPHGTRNFALSFDFIDHVLLVATVEGTTRTLALAPRSVADFYRELMATL